MDHRLYRGFVYHNRITPRAHAFRYPVMFLRFDLDRLDTADRLRLFGHNRRALFTLRDTDHFTGQPESLAAAARRFLGRDDLAAVHMITVPRILGQVFNPVTFYLGYDRDHHLAAALAEVNNTFGERHVYTLTEPIPAEDRTVCFRAAKAFHVSPFNDRRGTYLFRFRDDPDQLALHVDIERDGQVVFRSGLVARTGRPLTDRTLAAALARYPLQNLLTLPRIHFQAARLYFQKKMRYFAKPAPDSMETIGKAPPNALERFGRRVFTRLLQRVDRGRLTLRQPDGTGEVYGRPGTGPEVVVQVTDPAFFRRILLDGDIGLGEAYMYGQWTTPDLTAVIAFLIANRDALENGDLKTARLNALFNWFAHLLRSNTKTRSRKNISAHYDLSNDFFALFLDPTMLYSSAVFAAEDEPLEDAQRRKMRLLIEKAGIGPEHHVLEIGSGWGGMAIEMARTTGCRVTSVTISREQLALARERVAAAGLEDRVTIEFRDYRDIEGVYDRVVSIEMLEAVGHEHFDSFFRTIDRVLAPGGRAVLQVITIPHARYDAYRKSVDWIRIHIFPGGHLPSVEALDASMRRASALRIAAREDIGPHYAPTLARWRHALTAHRPDLDRMGYDDVFFRTWEYYFSYCEAAFATRTLGNHHLVLER